ncbi:hypothetical protein Taro_001319 [Colocasia esculenta]|uniref:DUF8040 domain-containing protein n=1 Tax=Colocasia esculenta TaxID=4460 RepID=A0A843TD84_COLES|nr:hypothetical protein [Colocasia esculenta]
MDVNDFSYEDEMDAAYVGALSACVGVLEILVNNIDNSGELNESIPRIPSSTRNEIRRKYVQSIIGVDDATSIKMIHMNRRTFYQLCAVVCRRNLSHETIHITVKEQLIMLLHTIAHNVRNGVMCVNYLRSGETINRYFNHVLKALRQLHNDYIRPPDIAIPDEIRSREIYWPWFKLLLTFFARFHGKTRKPIQNVLAAVRFGLMFSYVLAGWEGSTHDVLVLNDALQRQNKLIVPNGKYFLVDASYSTRLGFISPYRLNPNDELLNEITIEESTQLTSRRKTRRKEREDNAMWASIRDRIENEMWNDYSKLCWVGVLESKPNQPLERLLEMRPTQSSRFCKRDHLDRRIFETASLGARLHARRVSHAGTLLLIATDIPIAI